MRALSARALRAALGLTEYESVRLKRAVRQVAEIASSGGVHYSHRRKTAWREWVLPFARRLCLDWESPFMGEALLFVRRRGGPPVDCVEVIPSGDLYVSTLWFIGRKAVWCSFSDVVGWAESHGYQQSTDWLRTGRA